MSARSGHPHRPKDDAVGYKRPPKKYRFPPGVSGNPFGRPKRKRRWSDDELVPPGDIFGQEAAKLVKHQTAEGIVESRLDALVYKRAQMDAIAGKPAALKLVIAALERRRRAQEKLQQSLLEAAVDGKHAWALQVREHKARGLPPPEPPPGMHPDELLILVDGRVKYLPLRMQDLFRIMRRDLARKVPLYKKRREQLRNATPGSKEARRLVGEINSLARDIKEIEDNVPDWWSLVDRKNFK